MPPRRVIADSSDDDAPLVRSSATPRPRSAPRGSRSRSVLSAGSVQVIVPASSPPVASGSNTISQANFYNSGKNGRRTSRAPRHSRRSTGTSEPVLHLSTRSASPDPLYMSNDSSAAASPPFAGLTPPQYEYITESESNAAGPSGPSRGRPYVDIVFKPLEVLRNEYEYSRDVMTRPTRETRAWVLEEQRTRPRSPKRLQALRGAKVAGAYDQFDDDDFEDDFESEEGGSEDEESQGETSSAPPQRKTRQWQRNHSGIPDMPATRAQRAKRKRRRSSSRESNMSYNPGGPQVFSDGESELDDFVQWSDSETPTRTAAPTPRVLEKHRDYCERCQTGPADALLAKALNKKKKQKGKKRQTEDDDGRYSEEEEARMKEGWLECERCVVSTHWGCLPDGERRDVLTVIRTKNPDAPPRKSIGIDEVASFTCVRCNEYPVCFVCKERHIPEGRAACVSASPEAEGDEDAVGDKDADKDGGDHDPIDFLRSDLTQSSPPRAHSHAHKGTLIKDGVVAPLLFRCFRCKQAAHYEHLADPFDSQEDYTLVDLAREYQSSRTKPPWYCHQCRAWKWVVDLIIAWRPLPAEAVEPPREPGELPRWKDRLPREYLIKFKDRSFRHLAIFLEKGVQLDLVTDATLAARGDQMAQPTISNVLEDAEVQHSRQLGQLAGLEAEWEGHGPPPDDVAEDSIPVDWSSVDRLLDVYLLPPPRGKKHSQVSRKRVMSSESEDDDTPELEDGIQPPQEYMTELTRWENMAGRRLTEDDADEIAPRVTWFYAKWQDLQYDQSCWDTPPSPDDEVRYPAFKHALARFLSSRHVKIPVLNGRQCRDREQQAAQLAEEDPPSEQPDCVSGGKLMPFQLEGFQWLLYKHWSREGCILADDMGLGKTIQVASFLGYLCSNDIQTYPHLVIVPNSTITNWVREFEKWVPHVRVVPYYGEAASRKVINKYELYHLGKQGKAEGLKAHIVLTTYDMVTGAEFRVFNNIPRWETLIVDEGQRLKSDSSLMFNKLKTLHAVHRVLLTGTPLNNNLRELFNLLNFIDPANFSDLEELEARFEDLNESLVLELHNMLEPYILRRIKSQVLKLPPKVEIIVPISMTPVQKRLTKSLLMRSAEMLGNIRKKRKAAQAAKKRKEAEALEAAEASEVDGAIRLLDSDAPSRASVSPQNGGRGLEDEGSSGNGKAAEVAERESERESTSGPAADPVPAATALEVAVEEMDVD